MVQEGQVSEDHVKSIEDGLGAITSRFFELPVSVAWTTVAKGDGWTAGEPSTTSLVVMYVPEGLDQRTRTSLLKSICDLWSGTTGCSVNEIVATARDSVNQE
jgi:hypothetical protein